MIKVRPFVNMVLDLWGMGISDAIFQSCKNSNLNFEFTIISYSSITYFLIFLTKIFHTVNETHPISAKNDADQML